MDFSLKQALGVVVVIAVAALVVVAAISITNTNNACLRLKSIIFPPRL